MWVASAIAGLLALAQAIWIAALWVASLRATAPPTPSASDDAGAPRPLVAPDRAPVALWFALLLALLAVALATTASLADAFERQYQLAWVLALPGTAALGGLALTLTLLASPKPFRRPAAEIFAWGFGLAAFGIAACFGVAFLS